MDYSTESDAERIARQVYAEAADFFGQFPLRYGHKILYGPPHHQPPVLFIGYQPGRRTPEEYWDRWPAVCEYATQSWWPLNKVMWKLFDRKFLERCCGLNAIFVRAPSAEIYNKEYKDKNVRQAIERFCLNRVNRLVHAIEPQKIIVIGFKALELFGSGKPILKNSAERVLLRAGQVANRPAIATLHLSGAQISTQDLSAIRGEIMRFIE
jgi:hypothetical protein